jgi:hypothetical protein
MITTLILNEFFKSHLELLCVELQISKKIKVSERQSLAPVSKVSDLKKGP